MGLSQLLSIEFATSTTAEKRAGIYFQPQLWVSLLSLEVFSVIGLLFELVALKLLVFLPLVLRAQQEVVQLDVAGHQFVAMFRF